MNRRSDIELQTLYAGSDNVVAREALEVMMCRNALKLRDKARRLCGFDQNEADDLFGEMSVLVWERRLKYSPGDAPWIAWAIRVMCGCAADRRKRRRGKFASSVQSLGDAIVMIASSETSPEILAFRESFDAAVSECLAELKDPLRSVFVKHFYEEQTFEKVSESLQLGSGPTPAKYRYDQAVERLAKCLNNKGYGLDDASTMK
ncbi:MAG: sigma-70 family RNA polymerase sigma factor [Planctomycetota bacterium]